MTAATVPAPSAAATRERTALDRAAARMTVVLRVGLGTSLSLIAGAIALLLAEEFGSSNGRVLSARRLTGYLGGSGLLHGLAAGSPEAWVTVGVYALLATPILRVVTGLYYFRAARDRPMVTLTAIVLALLLVSLFVIGPVVR